MVLKRRKSDSFILFWHPPWPKLVDDRCLQRLQFRLNRIKELQWPVNVHGVDVDSLRLRQPQYILVDLFEFYAIKWFFSHTDHHLKLCDNIFAGYHPNIFATKYIDSFIVFRHHYWNLSLLQTLLAVLLTVKYKVDVGHVFQDWRDTSQFLFDLLLIGFGIEKNLGFVGQSRVIQTVYVNSVKLWHSVEEIVLGVEQPLVLYVWWKDRCLLLLFVWLLRSFLSINFSVTRVNVLWLVHCYTSLMRVTILFFKDEEWGHNPWFIHKTLVSC